MRRSGTVFAMGWLAASSVALGQPLAPEVRIHVRAASGIDQDIVRRIVVRNLGQAMYCYEAALRDRPELHGSVEIEAVLRASGEVETTTLVHTDMTTSTVPSCVLAAFRRWQFTESEAGIRSARVVFRFSMPPERPRSRTGIGPR